MTRVCLPVAVAEPLNALQRSSEFMINFDLLDVFNRGKYLNNFKDSPNESCKRLAHATLFCICMYSNQINRLRKPFNPILGETYEFVSERWRFIAEQVSHHPPISAFVIEGEGFKMEALAHFI